MIIGVPYSIPVTTSTPPLPTAQMAESTVAATPQPLKIITGADSFGCNLKDALVSHLRSLKIDVEDLGTSSYYSIAAEVGRRVSAANATSPSSLCPEIRGLVACGTGVGVSIFANKFPGVFASTCLSTAEAINTRSINNCNVLAVSGMSTSPESAIESSTPGSIHLSKPLVLLLISLRGAKKYLLSWKIPLLKCQKLDKRKNPMKIRKKL
ncbi:hypothetical protein GH714_003098 [Hevea brasiliensis]|uniref:Ribose-5-phosphate isomerase n=1 Tax=Hevea brasiliensis TaxID=3981 RepID=A0A6A6KGI2_HEVBR|nr:hypothetical protein GH714_003098 [Hevea brasiliensis]